MKTFIFALILAAITISGGILFNIQIDKSARVMTENEHIISRQLSAGDLSSALSEIEKLTAYIDKKRTVLASTIDHKFIDDIEVCIAEIRGFAEQGEIPLALTQCRRLEHLVRHLPTSYNLTLQNIL